LKRIVTAFALSLLALAAVGCAQTGAVSADGTQVIKVSAAGAFAPSGPAKAGAPVRLEFGPGSDCTAAVQFESLGIFEDLTDGGGVVDLPALEAGEYPLVCQSNMVMGVLTVE